MKKTIVVIAMIGLLLAATTGSAFAAWGFSLIQTSPTTFDLIYEDDGENKVTNGYLITLNDIGNVGPGWTGVNNCAPLNSTVIGDHPAPVIEVAVGAQSPAPGTTLTLTDGFVMATLTAPAPTTLGFDFASAFFQVFDLNGVLMVTGATMDSGGLDSQGDPTYLAPAGGGPAPPIPEIITIVLISIGLISIGGYIWYRRRHQQAVLAA